jgi:hypothetical protein
MHSFGLYSEVDGVPTPHYVFQASTAGPVVVRIGAGWHLSIDDLYETFVLAVGQYATSLRSGDKILAENFSKMFPKYGTLYIRLDPVASKARVTPRLATARP